MTPEDPRVELLLDELLDSHLTPEQVCAESPQLLPIVRKRWRKLKRLSVDLDRLFAVQCDRQEAEPEPPNIPGYEVEAVLGRGGMGIIYRVRHVKLNRAVALKMLLAGEYAGAVELARFRREAQAIAALQHPNIVQIYDVGDVDGRAYFTMELVGGGSLRQKLEGTPQPAQYCSSITETLASAIHAAHLRGIIHRDLKPGNILLTPDGTPKISDFGLARHFEAQSDITLDAAKVGTPSYMAPEQVLGKPGTVGPSADIYALGATLYELLVGRPPFRGETPSATEQQLLTQEPVPPSRLNAKVPRDLDTICLKCLSKEPQRRYTSAADLADDLRRFREGRPILARPLGRAALLWRWGRRNPTMAALLLTALALVGLASGGGTWILQQRAQHNIELRSEIGTVVTQAVSLRKGYHFHEARELLEQAQLRLGPAGPEDLRLLVGHAQSDLDLAERLDTARIKAATLVGGKYGVAEVEPLYISAFAEAGLGRVGDDSKAVSARVRDSALSSELIAALDDWAGIAPDRGRREWLLKVASEADQNPARNRLRQPEVWQDGARLTEIAKELNGTDVSPQLAIALDRAAYRSGGDALPLLISAQARHPQDFWINFSLGGALDDARRADEAIGYDRAALAIRPDVAMAHNNLGAALDRTGHGDEAIGQYKQALQLDPNSLPAHLNLGISLGDKGKLEEAMDHFQQVLRIDPTQAVSQLGVSGLLSDVTRTVVRATAGQDPENARLDEAERTRLRRQALGWLQAYLQVVIKLRDSGERAAWSPASWQTDFALASVRDPEELAKLPAAEREQWQHLWADVAALVAADPLGQGRAHAGRREWAQAADGYARALKQDPTDDGQFWFEYAAVSLLAGDRSGYTTACSHMIDASGKPDGPRAYHIARACTLAPDAIADAALPGRYAAAELHSNAKQFWSLTEQGALAYRAGRFEESVSLFEQSLKADSHPGAAVVNWLWLALADQRLGKTDEARRWLNKAQSWLDQYRDGIPPSAEQELGLHLHNWLEANILRREAEAMIPRSTSMVPSP